MEESVDDLESDRQDEDKTEYGLGTADDFDSSMAQESAVRPKKTYEIIAMFADMITPCLLLHMDKVQKNIDDMVARTEKLGIRLRPHMKTHKCLELGALQTQDTKRCIAVATLADAEFFADGEFDDIQYTGLFTEDKILRMLRLADRLERFIVTCDSDYQVDLLIRNPLASKKWIVVLKVDVGGKRGGILWDSAEGVELAQKINLNDAIDFEGVYAHDRQSYLARGVKQVDAMGLEAVNRLLEMADSIRNAGVGCRTVGLGSTPTASRPNEKMSELTELHPGNYIYYDGWQTVVGSADKDSIALKVATRVIGHYPHRNQLLIDAGAAAISHDGKGCLDGGSYCYFEGHPELRLKKVHHEVGFVEPKTGDLDLSAYPLGSILYILPYQSSSTAVMHSYILPYVDGGIVACWKLGARGIW